jgi:hypothetical protein
MTFSLARRAFRALKLLPKQLNRKQRFDIFVKNKIKAEIKAGNAKMEEIEALELIAGGGIEKKFALEKDSQIKNYLPPLKTFELLDAEAQEILQQKRSLLRIFASYISGNEKLRNV